MGKKCTNSIEGAYTICQNWSAGSTLIILPEQDQFRQQQVCLLDRIDAFLSYTGDLGLVAQTPII